MDVRHVGKPSLLILSFYDLKFMILARNPVCVNNKSFPCPFVALKKKKHLSLFCLLSSSLPLEWHFPPCHFHSVIVFSGEFLEDHIPES